MAAEETGQVTEVDAVRSAYRVLGEIDAGTLTGADVAIRAIEVCKSTVGIVGSGPADPLWSLHTDIARQFLAAGGLSSSELSEWVAVQKRRESGGNQ